MGERANRFTWETVRAGLASRSTSIDLLHMPMMATPTGARVPIVTTVHDVIPFVLPEYRTSRAMRINLSAAHRRLRAAAAVIAPSRHAASEIQEILGVPEARIFITCEAADPGIGPAAPDEDIGSLSSRWGITTPYIFNVGGFDVRKQLPLLIESFADAVRSGGADLTLVIAGAPHTNNPVVFPPLDDAIRASGIGDRIRLLGRVSEDDKRFLLRHAQMMVSPSIYEGFGLPALEAMASGVAVVVANRTSLPEIVGDGGILLEPNRNAFASTIARLASSPDELTDLRRRGLARARIFTWAKTANATVNVYRHVLGLPEGEPVTWDR